MLSGWSTPFIWRHDARSELIVIGKSHAVSYAPETGKELWRIGGLTAASSRKLRVKTKLSRIDR
jgi:hypothetical protein